MTPNRPKTTDNREKAKESIINILSFERKTKTTRNALPQA